jgi:hypothetical protein
LKFEQPSSFGLALGSLLIGTGAGVFFTMRFVPGMLAGVILGGMVVVVAIRDDRDAGRRAGP